MAVEVSECPGTTGGLGFCNQFIGPCFLLDLLGDEPMQEDLRGVILFLECNFVSRMDACRVGLLQVDRFAGHGLQVIKRAYGSRERAKSGNHVPVDKVIEDLLCMGCFFGGLKPEEFGITREVSHFAPMAHGHVGGGSQPFMVGLVLQGSGDRWMRHNQ